MEKIKQYLKYVGIATLVVGFFAGLRYLSLEFAGVRWTLLILICLAIFQKVGIPNFASLSLIVQLPLHYIVAGFLFGYGNINAFISAHWVGLLITIGIMLSLYIYMDIYIHKYIK